MGSLPTKPLIPISLCQGLLQKHGPPPSAISVLCTCCSLLLDTVLPVLRLQCVTPSGRSSLNSPGCYFQALNACLLGACLPAELGLSFSTKCLCRRIYLTVCSLPLPPQRARTTASSASQRACLLNAESWEQTRHLLSFSSLNTGLWELAQSTQQGPRGILTEPPVTGHAQSCG